MRRAWLGALALAMAMAATGVGRAQTPPASEPPRTRYTLHARLKPQAHQLEGHVVIDFVNSTTVPVRELMLHLYPNAFAGTQTVFAREGGFRLRGLPLERNGSLHIRELVTAAGEDLLAHAERELIPGDQTQLRVRLKTPVAPGEHLEARARFDVQLPSLVARMGQASDGDRDFAMIAQWFPKLAKLMPDGTWRSTPYHGAGEFDADFADYELTVHVPHAYIVAAPGVRAASCKDPSPLIDVGARFLGLRSEHYTLHRALDIAWAAAPDLQRIRHRVTAGGVTVEAFAPHGASTLAVRQTELAARALDELGALLGPYPHPRLVVVIPPAYASGAAGMEYPGLVVGWSASAWAQLLPAASAHDVVTTHEVAHQWFPMIVASNEVQNPVLDEGLAEWLGLHLLRDRYGHASEWSVLGLQASRLLGVPLDAYDIAAASFETRHDVPSSWRAAYEVELDDLGYAMYLRPAIALEALARTHGRGRLLRALGAYARDNRFGHVGTGQLSFALDAEYGAGFADKVFVPALAGKDSALTAPTRSPAHADAARAPNSAHADAARAPNSAPADAARALPGRLLALAQLALSWLAP